MITAGHPHLKDHGIPVPLPGQPPRLFMNFIKKYFTTAPFILPVAGLFLFLMTFFEILNFWTDGVMYGTGYMLRPLLAIIYTVCWTGAVYLKKWGMYGFVAVTAVSWAGALLFAGNDISRDTLTLWQQPIPLNIIFSVLLLVFFKKFHINNNILSDREEP